jgi:predicted nucleic acid-binding protein
VIFPFTWPKSAELEKLPDFFFTDAYLLATAEADVIPQIASFDRGLRNVPGVRRIEP